MVVSMSTVKLTLRFNQRMIYFMRRSVNTADVPFFNGRPRDVIMEISPKDWDNVMNYVEGIR